MPSDTDHPQDYQRFGLVLRDLLIERDFTSRLGNPDWVGFARSLGDVHYETLRKAVSGERPVAPKIIESVAKKLKVKPQIFAEYRLWEVRRRYDPSDVGIAEALENLASWEHESTPAG